MAHSHPHWRRVAGLLPNFNFAQAMSDLYSNRQAQLMLAEPCMLLELSLDECCATIEDRLAELEMEFSVSCTTSLFRVASPGVGRYLWTLIGQAVLFSGLLLAVEAVRERRNRPAPQQSGPGSHLDRDPEGLAINGGDTDPDVRAERAKVCSIEIMRGSARVLHTLPLA